FLVVKLKQAQPPIWKWAAMKMQSDRITLNVMIFYSKPTEIIQEVFRYYHRQAAADLAGEPAAPPDDPGQDE
ncbi:MAG TPA: hypothetical protein VF607_10225, partial [Verrucomicrobiae bacterium]